MILNSSIDGHKGDVAIQVGDLHNVGTVSLHGSLSGITSGVVVATSPLVVDEVSLSHGEVIWYKVILGGGESLNNVATLSTDIQVVDLSIGTDSRGTRGNIKHVGTVLESSSVLGSVESKCELTSFYIQCWVVLDGGILSTVGEVQEVVSQTSGFIGGDLNN